LLNLQRRRRKAATRHLTMVAIVASVIGGSGAAQAYSVEIGKRVLCDPGVGIGGSNVNYFHAYFDWFCLSPGEDEARWEPGPIVGAEAGLIGPAASAGVALVNGGSHALTFTEVAFLARGRLIYPWGILGWERTIRYGAEIGVQLLVFRATVGVLWKHGETKPGALVSLDIGLL